MDPFLRSLSSRQLEAGEVLVRPFEPAPQIWFPVTGVLSVSTVLGNGGRHGTAMVGQEGLAPLAPFHEVDVSHEQVEVVLSGFFVCAPVSVFQHAVAAIPSFRRAIHRFNQALYCTSALASACDRMHTIDARLARKLLEIHDRRGEGVELSHETLAEQLGVNRRSVSAVAHYMRDSGMIQYQRGRIRVMDREALQRESCGCYSQIRDTAHRILTPAPAMQAVPSHADASAPTL